MSILSTAIDIVLDILASKLNVCKHTEVILTDQQHLIFVGTALVDGPTLSELLYAESTCTYLLPEVPPQGASPQLFPQKYNWDKVTCPKLCACLHLGPVNCNKNYCSIANNLGLSVATCSRVPVYKDCDKWRLNRDLVNALGKRLESTVRTYGGR
ncbi:ubiquitin-ribosomal protein eL40 fusion protein-like [Bos taurus]|uniref:ubiquitin-ribosomal protein eL40 fusion protein-like n=1 Tax=Bos taurus TaxID=9913 RepID=UPI000383B359|nr:ubiquitin-ribosomal protein eL40 fusion protein-like [Bos taurus]